MSHIETAPRLAVLAACLAVMAAGCGGGSLTLTEYAEEVERLVAEVGVRIDELDDEREANPITVESEKRYWEARVAVRTEFRDGMRDIDPPEEVEALHTAGLEVIGRLTGAEGQMAARAARLVTPADIEELYRGPEAAAWLSVDAEAVAICEAAQAEVDLTEERAAFEGNLWVPPELKEVVYVAFACTAEQRRSGG